MVLLLALAHFGKLYEKFCANLNETCTKIKQSSKRHIKGLNKHWQIVAVKLKVKSKLQMIENN